MEAKKKTDAFEIVKNIVGKSYDLVCNNYGHYLIISTSKTPYWICRINSTNGVYTISFPVNRYSGEASASFNEIDEISNYSKYIIDAFNTAITF